MIHVLLFLSLTTEACPDSNHGCKAERWVAKADESGEAGDHEKRAQRLYLAHREYLSLFDATHQPESLCRARVVLREAREGVPMPPDLVERFRTSEQDAVAREREAKVHCAAKKTTPKVQGRKKSAAPATKDTSPAVETTASPKSSNEPSSAADREPGVDVDVSSAVEPASSPSQPPEAPNSGPQDADQRSAPVDSFATVTAPAPADGLLPVTGRLPRPSYLDVTTKGTRRYRAQTAAGAVFVSAGVASLGVAVGALAIQIQDVQDVRAKYERIAAEKREPSPAEDSWARERLESATQAKFVVIGTSVASGVALAIGGALLGTRKRFTRPVAVRPYGSALGAGFFLRGEF